MTFLSGQDDFFQTANEPISVRHLSQPYNKLYIYTIKCSYYSIFLCKFATIEYRRTWVKNSK